MCSTLKSLNVWYTSKASLARLLLLSVYLSNITCYYYYYYGGAHIYDEVSRSGGGTNSAQ